MQSEDAPVLTALTCPGDAAGIWAALYRPVTGMVRGALGVARAGKLDARDPVAEWKKLSPGSKELKGLNAEARTVHAGAAAFVNACRNRYHVTESEAEALLQRMQA